MALKMTMTFNFMQPATNIITHTVYENSSIASGRYFEEFSHHIVYNIKLADILKPRH